MNTSLQQRVNKFVQVKNFQNSFRDIINEEQANADLKTSLDNLEKLVVGRTLKYVETIEKLKKENLQRRQAEDLLKRRDAILEAVSFSAQELMVKPDWQTVAQNVLEQLGKAAKVSRIYIFQCHNDSQGKLLTNQLYEWAAPEVKPLKRNLASRNFSFEQNGFVQWQKTLERGESIFGLTQDFPRDVQKILRAKKIKYIVLTPIMIDQKMWGLIGFDQCVVEKERSNLEIDALKTAANVLGAAVQRRHQDEILRKSRAHYRAVVDSQTEMICRFTEKGILTFVNNAYCRYFEKQREDLIGNHFFPFQKASERKKICTLLSSLNAKTPTGSLEHTHKNLDNRFRWQNWSYRIIEDDKKFLGEYQAVGWDISDKKNAEIQLQVTLDEQEKIIQERTDELKIAYEGMIQSEKMASLGILTAEIAHEINNPNNFITFNIPILEEYVHQLIELIENNNKDVKNIKLFNMTFAEFKVDLVKLLQNVYNGSTRINNTISRLRKFSWPSDQQALEKVKLKSVLTQSLEFCQSKTKKTVKSIQLDIPEICPEIITNPHSLTHIMVNLLINAAQSADKKDSWIRISVMKERPLKNQIIIRVEDNGCGMNSKTKQKIFDPFFTTKAKGVGTGLGLFISQSLINGVGGYIRVESKPGKGSCFDLILPAVESKNMAKKAGHS